MAAVELASPGRRAVEPMGPNMAAENVEQGGAVGLKRKADEEDAPRSKTPADGKENGSLEKRPKLEAAASTPTPTPTPAPAPLVELRGRKLIFRQEPLPIKYPKRLKLNFEGLLLDAEEAGGKVTEIPEDLYAIIVLAGHESSSASETFLAKQIVSKLLDDREDKGEFSSPLQQLTDTSDILPIEIVKPLIVKLFHQQHYGLLSSDFPASASGPTKVPAALQIRFWEAINPEQHFPADQLEAVKSRQAERRAARDEVVRLLEALDDVEKMDLLKGDKEEKKPVDASPKVEVDRKSREGTAATTDSRRSTSPVKRGKLSPEEEEAARLRKEEKEARKAAREEKRVAKDKEVQKKEAAVAKQAQAMSMFFKSKPVGTAAPSSPLRRESPAGPSSSPAGPTPRVKGPTDFERTFHPVAMRPNVTWAEINRWVKPRRRSQGEEGDSQGPAVEELARWAESGATEVRDWRARDFVDDHLKKNRSAGRQARSRLPQGLKSGPLYGTVADVWAAHQEAADPRKVLDQLRKQSRFPWKTLAFDQQARPPYSGTFTKKSVVVGPRTPFAQDPALDYSYDSGDDWEDEEGGDDVDDFGEGEGAAEPEDDEDEDEEDGEFDDWLDDEDDGESGIPGDGIDEGSATAVVPQLDQGRLPMKVIAKKREVPKRAVKVTPWWKGPEWEGCIGAGTDGLEVYRIQLLNDTPLEVDPFSYAAADIPAQAFKPTFSSTVVGANLRVKTLLLAEPTASAPEPTIAASAATTSLAPAPSVGPGMSGVIGEPASSKPRPTGPKVGFPISHLPELLQLIEGNTKIRTDLISQLKAHFDNVTSKAAIEAKIKEVAIREGKAKDSQWKVLPEAWAAIGMAPPSAHAQTNAPVPMVIDA